jgi:hypothetical protein
MPIYCAHYLLLGPCCICLHMYLPVLCPQPIYCQVTAAYDQYLVPSAYIICPLPTVSGLLHVPTSPFLLHGACMATAYTLTGQGHLITSSSGILLSLKKNVSISLCLDNIMRIGNKCCSMCVEGGVHPPPPPTPTSHSNDFCITFLGVLYRRMDTYVHMYTWRQIRYDR